MLVTGVGAEKSGELQCFARFVQLQGKQELQAYPGTCSYKVVSFTATPLAQFWNSFEYVC